MTEACRPVGLPFCELSTCSRLDGSLQDFRENLANDREPLPIGKSGGLSARPPSGRSGRPADDPGGRPVEARRSADRRQGGRGQDGRTGRRK